MKEVKSTMETTAFSILKLIRNLISRDRWGTMEYEKMETVNENDRNEVSPCLQSLHSCATFASVSSLVPSETSAFRKINPKMSSNNLVVHRGACSSENSTGAERNSDARDRCNGSESKSSKGLSKGLAKHGMETVDRDISKSRTETRETTGFIIGKDQNSNNCVLGKDARHCNSHTSDSHAGRKVSDGDRESSASIYETPPSTNIDSDSMIAIESPESFRSLSHESIPECTFKIPIGLQDLASVGGFQDVSESRTVVSEIFEELLTDVCRTEDQMIEELVHNVLQNAIHHIRKGEGFSPSGAQRVEVIRRMPGLERSVGAVPEFKSIHSVIDARVSTGICEAVGDGPTYRHRAHSYPSTSSEINRKPLSCSFIPDIRSAANFSLGSNKGLVDSQPSESKKDGFSSQLTRDLDPPCSDESSQSPISSASDSPRDLFGELPARGRMLLSSSLIDILITIQRTSDFFKELHNLVAPSTYHPKFASDFEKLRNERETFSAHLFHGLSTVSMGALFFFYLNCWNLLSHMDVWEEGREGLHTLNFSKMR